MIKKNITCRLYKLKQIKVEVLNDFAMHDSFCLPQLWMHPKVVLMTNMNVEEFK